MNDSTLEPEASPLSGLSFRFPLRRYQKEILELVQVKLERGERELHIVAPPGAGKTIIGLQMVCSLKVPSLIIAPTTTIQAQWAEKLGLFLPPEATPDEISELIGTHESKPLKPITVLTYQVLSTPGREQEYLEKLAHKEWIRELLSSGLSLADAEIRILELLQNNKRAHDREMARHVGRLRRRLSDVLDLKEVLHPNAVELMQTLRRQGVKLVVFDECHHLTDYWAAIMRQLVAGLESPLVIGLTGTPPEGKSAGQENRYLSLVGEIDYQVPTPALVREGGLAPFQDLVLFTSPTPEEEKFLEEQHLEFHALIAELTADTALCGAAPDGSVPGSQAGLLPTETAGAAFRQLSGAERVDLDVCAGNEPQTEFKACPGADTELGRWVQKRLTTACDEGWEKLSGRNPQFAAAICRFAWKYRLDLREEIELSSQLMQSPLLEDWMEILEDFALHYLKVSSSTRHHKLYDKIKRAVAKLGFGLTERGLRKQQSPVDKVLAFSKSKARAVAEILDVEYRNLDDRLKAVVVTDFERMSATATRSTGGVLSEESGGAIDVLREIARSSAGEYVSPCMVTGSLLLVDRRMADQFLKTMQESFASELAGIQLKLHDHPGEPFVEVVSSSSDWEARLYVGLATRLLERGLTKVLVGTRGIFGEGWDCQALNTLVDLTTTTTPMSVKQLRGRSIRINNGDPLGARKVANNWDVVCIAPHLEKGLNDYTRFARKHRGYFGICDDGQIECGVSHVHAAFSELSPQEVFASLDDFNQEMKLRALAREGMYDLWKVGHPYLNRTLGCIEVSRLRELSLTPPHIRQDLSYKEHAQMLRSNLAGVWFEYGAVGGLSGASALAVLWFAACPLALGLIPLLVCGELGRRRYRLLYERLKSEICRRGTQESALRDLALAVLSALQQAKLLPLTLEKDAITITRRSDGSHRVFLDRCDPEHAKVFVRAFREVLEPISNQPYLIPKYEYSFKESSARDDEPQAREDRFFRKYLKGRAEPRLAAYHPVPSLLARSERGREAFEAAWNKYVSPGFVVDTQMKPELLRRYFGLGPSLAERLIWE